MTAPVAVDTSVAVPLLQRSHREHATVVAWRRGRQLHLSGHALAETYSVLTRLPGDAAVRPDDAADLIARRFLAPLALHHKTFAELPLLLSRAGVAGGAVWDALVGLAARDADHVLASRDARALQTYRRLGVEVELVS